MALQIDPTVADKISITIKQSISELSPQQQQQFCEEFKRKARNNGSMIALAILFPIQLFFLGKTGLGIAFLLTSGGCGIWWLIEIFMTAGRVQQYNDSLAYTIIQNIKLMSK